ncbi:MAG: Gfo/Idh/MocA family protein [Anaerolineae bacterium]|jgi:predicted dehydrogenase
MSDKIRIAQIGVGQIGKHHLDTYKGIADAEVVAVCDIRRDEAERVAAEYGIPAVYTDYREMLKRDDIDSVDVCLHNRLHMPMTVAVLEAGKNCYCEKPMSWTYRDAKVMYDKAKETGKLLHIQLGTLYDANARGAKRAIDGGLLGDIYFAKAIHYRRRGRPWVDGYGSPAFVNTGTSGGGAMLDMAVYHISRMVWLLGNPDVVSVSGKTYQKIDMYADRRESGKYDVEELGMGFIRLAGDITFIMEESWAIHANDPNDDRVYGSKGGLRVEPLEFYTTIADMELDGVFDTESADVRWGRCDETVAYYRESQAHWVAAQQGKAPLIDTAGIALKTALITEGVYISSHLGREVTVEEIENAEPGFGRV